MRGQEEKSSYARLINPLKLELGVQALRGFAGIVTNVADWRLDIEATEAKKAENAQKQKALEAAKALEAKEEIKPPKMLKQSSLNKIKSRLKLKNEAEQEKQPPKISKLPSMKSKRSLFSNNKEGQEVKENKAEEVKKAKEPEEEKVYKFHRLEMDASSLAAIATITTTAAILGAIGGTLILEGSQGPTMALHNVISMFGSIPLALLAVFGIGMLLAGIIDNLYNLKFADRAFFQPKNLKDFGLKALTTLTFVSAPTSMGYFLGHAILFLKFVLKTAKDFLFNCEKFEEDLHALSDHFRSLCFNLAAVFVYPILNLCDLIGCILKPIKDLFCVPLDYAESPPSSPKCSVIR